MNQIAPAPLRSPYLIMLIAFGLVACIVGGFFVNLGIHSARIDHAIKQQAFKAERHNQLMREIDETNADHAFWYEKGSNETMQYIVAVTNTDGPLTISWLNAGAVCTKQPPMQPRQG